MSKVTHWTVPQDHPAFAGHFIDMPILPGVVLLDLATQMMAEANHIDPAHYQISTVKFLSPAQPGDALMIEQTVSAKGTLHFNILADDRKIATGSIIPNAQA